MSEGSGIRGQAGTVVGEKSVLIRVAKTLVRPGASYCLGGADSVRYGAVFESMQHGQSR